MHLQENIFDDSVVGTNGNVSFSIIMDEHGNFTISGWCIECQIQPLTVKIIPGLIGKFPPPASKNITQLSWPLSLQFMAGNASLSQPLYDYDEHDTFYVKSIKTKQSKILTNDQMEGYFRTIIEQGKKLQGGKWRSRISLWGGAHSQINEANPKSSAFGERDTLWVIEVCFHDQI
jgi:hypothetical protein